MWAQGSIYSTFNDIIKDHVRISENEYVPIEEFHISQEALQNLKKILQKEVSNNGMKSLLHMDDFSEYPQIDYEWNSFLLAGIIENFDIGFKIISHDFKGKYYNRKIIVCRNSASNSLPELVWELLANINKYELSQTEFLSFLLINELTISSIPFEIQNSEKFIFTKDKVYLKR